MEMARYKKDHKEKARSAILAAAGRRLKRNGFNGVGVDGLMAEAGVTSGAFYTHFGSKESLLQELMVAAGVTGVERLKSLREADPDHWLSAYLDSYLSVRHCEEFDGGCIFAALSADVSRLGEPVRNAYEASMSAFVAEIAHGLAGDTEPEQLRSAWTLVAMMMGGVVIARGLTDSQQAEALLHAIRVEANRMIRPVRNSAESPIG